MKAPVLVDLFCKAGGASRGYVDVGFDVIGIDIEPQPRYPYRFIRADVQELDASDLHALGAVAVAASPPCKTFTSLKAFASAHHENLIPATRSLLIDAGLPYVIENVVGAPLIDEVMLCGSMFHLAVRRHRLFEIGGWGPISQPACRHVEQEAASPGYRTVRGHGGGQVVISPVVQVYGGGRGYGKGEVELWRKAMGIDWMTRAELTQAVPPAYTRWIGARLIHHVIGMEGLAA